VLKIRLRRMGSKHDAFYRVVVSDSRRTPRGPFVDILGTYDPRTSPATLNVDLARAQSWLHKGAHASPTVHSLLTRARAIAPRA
jgi:small subunit ribosomal protein S16